MARGTSTAENLPELDPSSREEREGGPESKETPEAAVETAKDLAEMRQTLDAKADDAAQAETAQADADAAHIQEKYGPMTGDESAKLSDQKGKVIDARNRFTRKTREAVGEPEPVPAATPEAPAESVDPIKKLEGDLRDLDRQLEEAHGKGDKMAQQKLEARREEIDAERKKLMAEKAAEAPKAETAAEPVAAAAVEAPVDRAAQLEGELRGLEAQRAALQGSEDTWAPDKKAALERQLEEKTLEWQQALKERDAALAAENDPVKKLEARLRELERLEKEAVSAGDTDARDKIRAELEKTTREWEAARAAQAKETAAEAPAEAAKEEAPAAPEKTIEMGPAPEVLAAMAAAEAAKQDTQPDAAAARKPDPISTGGGSTGWRNELPTKLLTDTDEKKDEGKFGKKMAEWAKKAWDILGGWIKK